MWVLLYGVDPRSEINRAVDIAACDRCRLPLCLFDVWKTQFKTHWERLLDKRGRRLAYLLQHGSVPDGWTPPIKSDGRSSNYPYASGPARQPGARMIYTVRRVRRYELNRSVKDATGRTASSRSNV